MFVVTFYSYKGGVGRTMALANIAYELANKGRKLLIVDFDLEAPGLTSYELFKEARGKQGLVEYVTTYIDSGVAADVRDYIFECKSADVSGSIYVMPAGKGDPLYGTKYNQLDWQKLYDERDGFLFFEDLKQQWNESFSPKFDYVLIDSRTGHTDIGGICTRQLPEATVLMFYPNSQNIDGISTVAQDIRLQSKDWEKRINLIFCPSNVPDLDDEKGILEKSMHTAADRVGYGEANVIINHYNSLDLVDQVVFAKDRPRTRLAQQYGALCKDIIRRNLEDKEGALAILEGHWRSLRIGKRRSRWSPPQDAPETFWSEFHSDLDKIQQLHGQDGKVAWFLAMIFNELGDADSEAEALSIAVEMNYRPDHARRNRAALLIRKNDKKGAIDDLRSVISSEDASAIDISAALTLLAEHDPHWVSMLSDQVLDRLDADDKVHLATQLHVDVKGALRAAEILRGVVHSETKEEGRNYEPDLILALIGAGQFSAALEVATKTREEMCASDQIEEIFNYGMAEWGETGSPPVDLLQRVVHLNENAARGSANYEQCIALTLMGLQRFDDAMRHIKNARSRLAPGRIFSCWIYQYRRRTEMQNDLREMENAAKEEKFLPRFLEAQRDLLI